MRGAAKLHAQSLVNSERPEPVAAT
jgi:hypothetical protein